MQKQQPAQSSISTKQMWILGGLAVAFTAGCVWLNYRIKRMMTNQIKLRPEPELPGIVLDERVPSRMCACLQIYGVPYAQHILKSKVDVNQVGNSGWTFLHAVANKGNSEVAKLLLDAKADPNVTKQGDDSSLMCAAGAGNVEVAKLLVDAKADIMYKNEFGHDALTRAAIRYGLTSDRNEKEAIYKVGKYLIDEAGADAGVLEEQNPDARRRIIMTQAFRERYWHEKAL